MTVATEVLPSPLAVDAVVSVDFDTRTLAVRLPDAAGGHTRALWRAAHQALLTAEQSGFRSRVPTVWAHTDRRRDIAHGRPGEFATLRFTFPRAPRLGLFGAGREARPGRSRHNRPVGRPLHGVSALPPAGVVAARSGVKR